MQFFFFFFLIFFVLLLWKSLSSRTQRSKSELSRVNPSFSKKTQRFKIAGKQIVKNVQFLALRNFFKRIVHCRKLELRFLWPTRRPFKIYAYKKFSKNMKIAGLISFHNLKKILQFSISMNCSILKLLSKKYLIMKLFVSSISKS